jgi:hypothetical protein
MYVMPLLKAGRSATTYFGVLVLLLLLLQKRLLLNSVSACTEANVVYFTPPRCVLFGFTDL